MSMASTASREWVNVQSSTDREYPTDVNPKAAKVHREWVEERFRDALDKDHPFLSLNKRASSDPPQRHAGKAGTSGGSASGVSKRKTKHQKSKVSR